jgi:hypothetical protein
VTPIDTWWIGPTDSRTSNLWNQGDDTVYIGNGGVTFSWANRTVPPGGWRVLSTMLQSQQQVRSVKFLVLQEELNVTYRILLFGGSRRVCKCGDCNCIWNCWWFFVWFRFFGFAAFRINSSESSFSVYASSKSSISERVTFSVTCLPSPSAAPFPEDIHVVSNGAYSSFGLIWMNSSKLIPIRFNGTGFFTIFEIDDIPGRVMESAIVGNISVSSEVVYSHANELSFTIHFKNKDSKPHLIRVAVCETHNSSGSLSKSFEVLSDGRGFRIGYASSYVRFYLHHSDTILTRFWRNPVTDLSTKLWVHNQLTYGGVSRFSFGYSYQNIYGFIPRKCPSVHHYQDTKFCGSNSNERNSF